MNTYVPQHIIFCKFQLHVHVYPFLIWNAQSKQDFLQYMVYLQVKAVLVECIWNGKSSQKSMMHFEASSIKIGRKVRKLLRFEDQECHHFEYLMRLYDVIKNLIKYEKPK